MGSERRLCPRIRTSLEVRIGRLEPRATLRRGDIGLGGLFVETDVDPGEPGTVHALRLRSRDKALRVDVPGRVVRVHRSDDLLHAARVSGVAFELLTYEPGKADEVAALVRHVARAGGPAARRADRGSAAPSLGGLTLETDWRLRRGERVRVEVPSPEGASVTLEGWAVRSRKTKRGTYRTRLALDAEPRAPHEDRTVTGVREAMRARPAAVDDLRPPHLGGELRHVRVPSLLSLLSLERMTGVVRLARGEAIVRIFVRDGDVVDVVDEARAEATPRELLSGVVEWEEGRFAVHLEPVDRPDRLGVSTTGLLLDLARACDEQRRVA
jgi:hypothetical protein